MQVYVEFFGVARLLTGEKGRLFQVQAGATVETLVGMLRDRFPQLVGDVIQQEGTGLQEPNIFHIKGTPLTRRDLSGQELNDGDELVLMSLSAGG